MNQSRLHLDELAAFALSFLPPSLAVFQEVSLSRGVGLRRSGRRQAGAADGTTPAGRRLHPGLS